ncbi:MAG: hypothetical protein EOM05_12775 [Clostridia bacterium]|nr:hypothetical protein [Clostridia bacterium]
MEELNAIVQQVVQVSPIMKVFRIAPLGWTLPDFKPGQFVAIGLPPTATKCPEATEEPVEPDPDKLIKRAYSVASSNLSKDYVEFYITLVHSGALTPRLFNLNIGDKIWLGGKFVGMFTLDQIEENQNIILIGTGTGVASATLSASWVTVVENVTVCEPINEPVSSALTVHSVASVLNELVVTFVVGIGKIGFCVIPIYTVDFLTSVLSTVV